MTKPFSQLHAHMSLQSQQRSLAQAQKMLAAMQYPNQSDANALRQASDNLDGVLAEKNVKVDELVEEFKSARKGHRG
jgi:hypothetical protein